jgi:DNA-binding NarL/FixJ family response regulator
MPESTPPHVLVIDASEHIRSMLEHQLFRYSPPEIIVHKASTIPAARHIMRENSDQVRVIAIGSLTRHGAIVGDEVLSFIRAATRPVAIPVIGASSVQASATAMLKAGCRNPIVTDKSQWYRPILAVLGITPSE